MAPCGVVILPVRAVPLWFSIVNWIDTEDVRRILKEMRHSPSERRALRTQAHKKAPLRWGAPITNYHLELSI
jgi:hypothetical protein